MGEIPTTVPTTEVVDVTLPATGSTVISPELDPRYILFPAELETMELGRKGRVIAVPVVVPELAIGTSVKELVLAAYAVVVEVPVVVTVTTFWPYWGLTFRLQSGVLQVAVMMAVPEAPAVTVAVTAPVVPVTVELPIGLDAQVRRGATETPLVSSTSAVRDCVPAGERVKDVLEPAAS